LTGGVIIELGAQFVTDKLTFAMDYGCRNVQAYRCSVLREVGVYV